MRRANVQLQADRRSEILAAAQTCFARSGFHQTSMQEICAEAGMSPGNLYRYFRSKEDIIAGIAERDRAETAQQFRGGRRRGISSTALRRSRSSIWSSAASRKSRSVPRSWRRAAAILPSRASTRTWKRTCGHASSHCCKSAAERGEIRRDHRPRRRRDGAVRARRRAVMAARGRTLVQRRGRDAARAAHGRAACSSIRSAQRQRDRGTES